MTSEIAENLRRWLWNDALPLWVSVGADPAGGYYEGIDLQGQPHSGERRLRVQARQTWVFARAHENQPNALWRKAIAHGLNYLFGPFQRDDGLFHSLLNDHGVASEAPAFLYDQAFVLLALAAVRRAEPESDGLEARGNALMRAIVSNYRTHPWGYREASPDSPFYANPQMHLLEALLAWEEIDPAGPWRVEADHIAGLALRRFVDPKTGVVLEHFNADWTPAAGVPGRTVEPGHQFEWSWLLRRWGLARGNMQALTAADVLLSVGSRHGVDRTRGVAFNSMLDDFTDLDLGARLWPQAEWLKAMTIAARVSEDPVLGAALMREAEAAARALQLYLQTDIRGLWRDTLSPEGVFQDGYAPASSLYHIAGAILEL